MSTADPQSVGLDPGALAKLDAAVQADIDAGRHFGAAILVARGGHVVHRANLGTVAPGRAAADGDLYQLQSMSKSYTAALVLRAVDEDRFTLDTRVADLVPDYGRYGKTTATVRQLLCHTAGLPAAPVAPPLPLTAMGQLRRHSNAICRLKDIYAPGTRCVYTSGTGYDMLGRILIDTDPKGRGFNQIAREELFEPLGLTNTSFGLGPHNPRRVPVAFTASATTPVSAKLSAIFNTAIDEQAAYPCAGAFADVDDVLAWTEALQGRSPHDYRVISGELFAEARKNQTGDMPLEALMAKGPPTVLQLAKTFGLPTLIKQIRFTRQAAKSGTDAYKAPVYPANFTLLGGYTRGVGDFLTTAGRSASPNALSAMGGGSTGWMIDPQRDLTFVFLSAGMVEGFAHPRRLERLADLAIAAVRD